VVSSSGVVIKDNHIHDVADYKNSGEHLDGIQLFASGPAGVYPQPVDITIEENLFSIMPGQMIFIQSNYVSEIGYIENVFIRRNILLPRLNQMQYPFHFKELRNTFLSTILSLTVS
jgi:hypothetical protein